MKSSYVAGHAGDDVGLCASALNENPKRIREIADFAKSRGESLVRALVDKGGFDESTFLASLGRSLGLTVLGLEVGELPESLLSVVSPIMASEHGVIPVGEQDGVLLLACSDPFKWREWDELEFLLGRPIGKVLAPRHLIEQLTKKYYGIGADTVNRLTSDQGDSESSWGEDVEGLASEEDAGNEPTVVNLVNQIIAEGAFHDATDIHFEPHDGRFRIRYRIDGMLEDVSISSNVNVLRAAIVSRIKIMSGLNIAEKRLPQDGRARLNIDGAEYDLRISVLPGVYGEAVVVRIQNRRSISLDLESLGFLPKEKAGICDLIRRPHGLVLVTGPTGSGKTTTLYTCLKEIRSPQTKIITIEDPVEYWMDDILQMQVKSEIGFTFSTALRSILRHDPDVILVGEIRDQETADIAIRSALTGHLVFATLHTNDAPSSISRLCDIGVDPSLLASSLHGVIAQRLLRRTCQECRQLVPVSQENEAEADRLDLKDCESDGKVWRGVGCEKCRFTGYRGRFAAAEVLVMNRKLQEAVHAGVSAEQMRQVACESGMRTLRECAVAGVQNGWTTVDEVMRVTQGVVAG